jgi:hypothetical protein
MWSLLLNKYVLAAIGVVLLSVGIAGGIHSINKAYTERAALKVQVKQQLEDIRQEDDTIASLRTTVTTDQQDKQKLVDEIALRDKLATDSAARNAQLTKELKNANTTLAKWKSTASSALQSCLNAPLPDGLFGDSAGQAAGAGDDHSGQVRTPAGG